VCSSDLRTGRETEPSVCFVYVYSGSELPALQANQKNPKKVAKPVDMNLRVPYFG
jgi:hypothetical protein